jgi:cytochrome b561
LAAYLHIAVGVTILLVMIARLRERIRRPVQTAPESRHRTMAFLGRLNHWAFYVILLAMPPVGAIAWFGGSEAAGAIHSFVSWVLVALILLHVGGALLHLLLGEPVIRRMFRPSAES